MPPASRLRSARYTRPVSPYLIEPSERERSSSRGYCRDEPAGELKQLRELKGKELGCWCKPNKCHGDILLELIDKYVE
jgi:hypothetical protein